jgi:hypothetical protein
MKNNVNNSQDLLNKAKISLENTRKPELFDPPTIYLVLLLVITIPILLLLKKRRARGGLGQAS